MNPQVEREFWVDNTNIATLPGVSVRAIYPHMFPEQRIRKADKTLADGSIVTSVNLGSRPITVKLDITQTERSTLDTNYQTLLRYLRVVEKKINFAYGTTNKNFTATLKAIAQEDPQGGYLPLVVTYDCSDPYAYAVFTDTATSAAKTTSSFNTSIANDGTESVPVALRITLTAASVNASDTITITGTNTTMTITRTYVAGDVIVIDPSTLSVTVNGTQVDYGGQMPFISAGTSSLGYADTFTTRTVTLVATWVERYL